MKTKIQLALVFLILLNIVSCTQKPTDDEATYSVHFTEADQNISFDQLVKSFQYIALETNENCLIKEVDKILFHNNKIIISSARKNIYVFDKNGKFITSIGSLGRGPGQYLFVTDMSINGDILYVYDNTMMSLSSFSLLDYQFIDNIKLNYSAIQLEVLDKKMIAFVGKKLNYYYKGDEIVTVANKNKIENIYSKYLNDPEYNTLIDKQFINYGGKAYISNTYRNKVYKITENKFECLFQLIDKNGSLTENEINLILNLESDRKFLEEKTYYITNFLESERFFSMNFLNKNTTHYLLFDKETNNSICVNDIEKDYYQLAPIDFDATDGQFFYSVLDANSIQFLKRFHRTLDKEKGIEDVSFDNPNYRIFDNVGEEDNPLIAVYELNPIE